MRFPTIRLRERTQTPGEEIANSVSHGVAAIVAVIAAAALVGSAARGDDPRRIVGVTIFAATLVFLYLASTLYHALPQPRVKRVFKILDHSAILLLIAGTYTPFTLGVLRDSMGLPLLAFVWAVAAFGVGFTAVTRVRYPTIFTLLVLAMGWTILVAVKPLVTQMDPWGLFWLGAGGLAYTGGVAFFAADRVRFGHLVWHVCVILGSACHFVAVWRYAG